MSDAGSSLPLNSEPLNTEHSHPGPFPPPKDCGGRRDSIIEPGPADPPAVSRRELLAGTLGTAAAALCPSRTCGLQAHAEGESFPWLRTSRIVLAEGYVPPFYPRLTCSPERLAERAEQMGADVLRFPAVSQYALYPTKHYPVHPELGERDLLKETIVACRKRGIKVIPYVAVNVTVWPVDLKGELAQWVSRDAEGRPVGGSLFSLHRQEKHLRMCLLSPFAERIKAVVEEIARDHDVDGMYFDGPYPYMASMKCYCDDCRTAYRQARGKEIPLAGTGLSAGAEREYLDWMVNDVVVRLVRELREIILRRKPIPLIANLTPFLFPRSCSPALVPLVDAFLFESRPGPLTNRMHHLLMGRTTGKVIWSYLSTPHLTETDHLRRKRLGSWYSFAVDGAEVAMQGYTAIASGAAPIYWGLNNRDRAPGETRHLRAPFDFLKRHTAMLQSMETVPFVGLMTSTSTVDWYRYRPGGGSGYSASHYYGAFALLKDAHVQVEPFPESAATLQQMSRYRLVVLPNVACLSDRQAEAIRQYVRAGGALLATYETSLFDERGAQRPDFALADLFGAHWRQSPDWGTDLFVRFEADRTPQLCPPNTNVPQDPDVTIVAADAAKWVLANTVQAAREELLGPALVVRPFGQGRVAYLAGSPEAVYYESRIAEVRTLVARVVDHLLAQSPQPYRLRAPLGVLGNLTAGPSGLLLHVLSNVGDKWGGSASRETYVPVSAVRAEVHVPSGRKVKAVRLLATDQPCDYQMRDSYVRVDLPPVNLYEGVLVELV